MTRTNISYWCPHKCGKRVVGLNISVLHSLHVKKGKRFICHNCERMYTVKQLEDYGNNMHKVTRQANYIKESRKVSILKDGNNEW